MAQGYTRTEKKHRASIFFVGPTSEVHDQAPFQIWQYDIIAACASRMLHKPSSVYLKYTVYTVFFAVPYRPGPIALLIRYGYVKNG